MRKQVTFLNRKPLCDNHNTWVCSLCYPFALEIGKVYSAGSLIYMRNHPLDKLAPRQYGNGTYALLQGQGHRDDELAFLTEKPMVTYNKKYKYFDMVPGYIEMCMSDAVDIFQCYIEKKFIKPDSTPHNFQYFFITKLAKLVSTFEKKHGNIESYYEKFCKEREKWVNDRIDKNVRK